MTFGGLITGLAAWPLYLGILMSESVALKRTIAIDHQDDDLYWLALAGSVALVLITIKLIAEPPPDDYWMVMKERLLNRIRLLSVVHLFAVVILALFIEDKDPAFQIGLTDNFLGFFAAVCFWVYVPIMGSAVLYAIISRAICHRMVNPLYRKRCDDSLRNLVIAPVLVVGCELMANKLVNGGINFWPLLSVLPLLLAWIFNLQVKTAPASPLPFYLEIRPAGREYPNPPADRQLFSDFKTVDSSSPE